MNHRLQRLLAWLREYPTVDLSREEKIFSAAGRAMSGGWRLPRPPREQEERSTAVQAYRRAGRMKSKQPRWVLLLVQVVGLAFLAGMLFVLFYFDPLGGP